jgi:tubulin beta
MSNNSAIVGLYKGLAEKFAKMFRKKAFAHGYTSEGIDELEFAEAESNLSDLQS